MLVRSAEAAAAFVLIIFLPVTSITVGSRALEAATLVDDDATAPVDDPAPNAGRSGVVSETGLVSSNTFDPEGAPMRPQRVHRDDHEQLRGTCAITGAGPLTVPPSSPS